MASFDHKPSRRALLGAALGLPLVGRGGSLGAGETAVFAAAPPPPFGRSPSPAWAGEDWGRALSAFRSAAEAVAAHEERNAGASFVAAEAAQPEYDRLCGVMEAALLVLLGCPAPDVAGLAVKLGLADAYEVWTMDGGEGVLAALAGEAGRLAS